MLTRAICHPSSEIWKHAIDTACVFGTNVVRLPEITLPLGRLLGEDVAAVGVACLVLAGSGLPEALGRAPMRLDLGHCVVLEGFLLLARAVAMARWVPPRFPSCPCRLRSEEHTSELQSLMRISYAVFCLKKKKNTKS